MQWLAERWLAPHLPLQVWPGVWLMIFTEVRGPAGMRFTADVLRLAGGWWGWPF